MKWWSLGKVALDSFGFGGVLRLRGRRAIAASLQLDGGVNATAAASTTTTMTTTTTTLSPADRPSDAVSTPGSQEAAALAHALELSARESQLEELRRKEEDEMLQRILELSLVEH